MKVKLDKIVENWRKQFVADRQGRRGVKGRRRPR